LFCEAYDHAIDLETSQSDVSFPCDKACKKEGMDDSLNFI